MKEVSVSVARWLVQGSAVEIRPLCRQGHPDNEVGTCCRMPPALICYQVLPRLSSKIRHIGLLVMAGDLCLSRPCRCYISACKCICYQKGLVIDSLASMGIIVDFMQDAEVAPNIPAQLEAQPTSKRSRHE